MGKKFVEVVDLIEIGSFMFKASAWIFFHDNILIDTPDSDWGPDCVWCQVFSVSPKVFGNTTCLRSLHYGIIHTDRKTNKMPRHLNKANSNALELYKRKVNETFPDKIKISCFQTVSKYNKFDTEDL